MSTLEIIVAELKRQHDESGASGLGYLDLDDLSAARLDGQVNLRALAHTIDTAINEKDPASG